MGSPLCCYEVNSSNHLSCSEILRTPPRRRSGAFWKPNSSFQDHKHPNRKHLFSCRFTLRSMTKCPRSHSGKKHDSTPRPSKILLIFTDSGMSRCFATQDEYLSHVDVSRGHSKTIYNQSWHLAGNFNFAHTLIKNNDFTIKRQTLSHGNVPSDHFWKICDRCKHPSCNFDFPSARIENICFHAGSPFGPWPSVEGAIPEKNRLDPEAF